MRDTLLRQAFQRLNRGTVETVGPGDLLSAVTSLKRGANEINPEFKPGLAAIPRPVQ
jgi:hypothetical protein